VIATCPRFSLQTLDKEAVRITAGLRFGVDSCVLHVCPCGTTVDDHGSHGFLCHLAFSHTTCLHLINDLIWKALSKAGIPFKMEPLGNKPDSMSNDSFSVEPV
jgi:hypothetical protein